MTRLSVCSVLGRLYADLGYTWLASARPLPRPHRPGLTQPSGMQPPACFSSVLFSYAFLIFLACAPRYCLRSYVPCSVMFRLYPFHSTCSKVYVYNVCINPFLSAGSVTCPLIVPVCASPFLATLPCVSSSCRGCHFFL